MSKKEWGAYGIYTVVALAVLAPLLLPGFILTLDLVFTPHLPMPEHLTSSYLFHAALHVLNIVLPSEIIEKTLLLGILLLSMIGLHRLVRALPYRSHEGEWGIYIASVVYAINPFTYSRFMAGQYAVLLGYALLPWFTRLLLSLGRHPGVAAALKLGGLATIIGIVSIHTLGAVAVLSAVAVLLALRQKAKWSAYLRWGLGALGIFVVLSSYWLLPLITGHGHTAQMISGFTTADNQAFATGGGSAIGKLGNVIRLQGFWAEDRGLYLLPQDRVILWGLLSLVVIALAILGAAFCWKRRPTPVLLLGCSAVIGLVLATGILTPLFRHLPLLAGFREPQKFAGLLALGYATFLGLGIDSVLRRMRERHEMAYALGAVIFLVLPFLYMRVMVWGFDGQLSPRHFPSEWSAVNKQLTDDPDHFTTVFLPWHHYMSFPFAGRIIANPAPLFFTTPVLISTDPELGGASGGTQTAQQAALQSLLAQPEGSDLSTALAQQNVKYLILAKDSEDDRYNFVQHDPRFKIIADYPSLQLLQNLSWRTP